MQRSKISKPIFDGQVFPIVKPEILIEQELICSMGPSLRMCSLSLEASSASLLATQHRQVWLMVLDQIIGVVEVTLDRPLMTTPISETSTEDDRSTSVGKIFRTMRSHQLRDRNIISSVRQVFNDYQLPSKCFLIRGVHTVEASAI